MNNEEAEQLLAFEKFVDILEDILEEHKKLFERLAKTDSREVNPYVIQGISYEKDKNLYRLINNE